MLTFALQLNRGDSNSEISLILLATVEVFSAGLRTSLPVSFVSVVMKPGSNSCKPPLKGVEEEEEEVQKVTWSVAAAEEMSVDAVAVAVSQ